MLYYSGTRRYIMKKSNKGMEIFILLIIIVSIIAIISASKKLLKDDTKLSDSNSVKNYSETTYYKYTDNFKNSYIYNLPSEELINEGLSSYEKYLTSTDNVINTYTERIKVSYKISNDEEENTITNFCNAYNEIESTYQLQCKKSYHTIKITNIFFLDKLKSSNVQTKKYDINLPVKKNTKLSNFLEEQEAKEIKYMEVPEID
jgi:hypothetical protein